MEETLVTSAVDFSGRPFLVFQAEILYPKIGDFDSELVEDFWQGFASNAMCNLHILCTTVETLTTSQERFSRAQPERYAPLMKSIRDKRVSQVPKASSKIAMDDGKSLVSARINLQIFK